MANFLNNFLESALNQKLKITSRSRSHQQLSRNASHQQKGGPD